MNYRNLTKAMFLGSTKYFTLLIVSLIFGAMMIFTIAGFMNVNPIEGAKEWFDAREEIVDQGGSMSAFLDWKLLGLALFAPMLFMWGNQVWMKYNELEGKLNP